MPADSPTISPNVLNALNAPGNIPRQSAAAALDSEDFLRLMTAQLANQDPLEPQSNEQMVAQLAQFSSLENETVSRATLADISEKLDALILAQERAAEAAAAAAAAASGQNGTEPNPQAPAASNSN